MKKFRSLLGIVMALSIVIGLPVNSSVYAAGIDIQSSETVQTDEENETTWQTDENDLWGEISDLEYFSHAQTVEDYESLMPQIEEFVTSSPEFDEGSLYYKDGALYWEVNDDPKCYDPVIRAQMNSGAPLSVQPITVPQSESKLPESSGYSLDESGIKRSSAFPQEGAVDVCAFLPYSGTKGDNFSSLEGVAEKVADYTGGEVLCYKGEDATVDELAKAVQSCAMVMIGSHGSNGAFGIITDKGINDTDKNSGHYADWGPRYYYDSENNKIFDYNLWMIDGTIISNHMTHRGILSIHHRA